MKSLHLIILVSLNTFALHKDFAHVNDRAPVEFKLLFESMKNTLKDMQDQIKLVVLCQHINKGLGPLSTEQSMFLLKSESYKSLLEWRHPPSQFQVGTHTIERLKKSMEANSSIYTPYSKWILESLIADLENFKEQGVLDLNISQKSGLKGEKALQLQKLQKVLKYSRGWVEQADTLSAKDFNQLTENLAWRTLERVKERAVMFRRFSSRAIQDKNEMTFNIPENGMPHTRGKTQLSETKVDAGSGTASQGEATGVEGNQDPGPQSESSDQGLANQSEKEKAAAQGTMENINTGNITTPPSELSGAIDELTEEIR
jgi:hypothetical protein